MSPSPSKPRLVLASTSPRRRALLTEAGIAHIAISPGVDDGELQPGNVPPPSWVMALAHLKASAGLRELGPSGAVPSLVLGADTLCVCDGALVGQPRNAAHAGEIIRRFLNREHEVLSGVALLHPDGRRAAIFFDRAVVHVGHIADPAIDAYLASHAWKGKAGAYNLTERLEAGWPITFKGDPTTIVGLPMQRLRRELARLLPQEAVA